MHHVLHVVFVYAIIVSDESLLGKSTVTFSLSLSLYIYIIEPVDSISRDEPDSPLTQYITNAGISHARYTITHFKHHHRVLRLISNRISV